MTTTSTPPLHKPLRNLTAHRISPGDTVKLVVLAGPKDGSPTSVVFEIWEPGGSQPPNSHAESAETFVVLAGSGHAYSDEHERDLGPGDVLVLPAGSVHRIANTSATERMYTLTVMSPDNGFADLIERGPVVDLDERDLAALRAADADEPGLLAAFCSYEHALATDDVEALDHWFLDAPYTLRSERDVVVVGHAAIGDFRRGRGGAPARTVERLHVNRPSDSVAVLTAETLRADRSRGVQTQVWQRTPDGWRICVAHVSAGPPDAQQPAQQPAPEAANPAVWRTVGSPLVPHTAEGSLSGKRLAVKDLFAVAGEPVGAGNPAWLAEATAEPYHAESVKLLLGAGADIAGIARTDELAFSLAGTNAHYGTPPNPAAPGRITGGSSSGPASAVAHGWADLGLATDTGGSIRVPASYCGLYGWRPTHGRVPTAGLLPLAPSFDTAGLLAADPALLRAGAEVLLPPPGPGEAAPVRTLAVDDFLTGLAEPEVRASFLAACRVLSLRTGLPLVSVRTPAAERLETWFRAFRTVQTAEAWEQHGEWITRHTGALAPDIAARFASGREVTDRHAAEAVVRQAYDDLLPYLADGTALLLPAASGPAPETGLSGEAVEAVRARTLRLTCVASLAGLPATVSPLLRIRGLPVGLCAIARRGADRALLDLTVAASRPGLSGSPAEPQPLTLDAATR